MRLATVPSEKDDRRKALILAGRKLFAKRGLDGTTVRDIAAEAEASLCLISYHFGSKEGLYRACIEEFALGRMEVAKSILAPVSTTEEFKQRLKLFIDSLGASHLDQPDIQKILQRELDSGFPIAREVFEKTLL